MEAVHGEVISGHSQYTLRISMVNRQVVSDILVSH